MRFGFRFTQCSGHCDESLRCVLKVSINGYPMNHKRHLKKYKERDRDGLPFPLKGSSNTYGRLIIQNRERSGDTGKDSIIFDGAWGGGRGGEVQNYFSMNPRSPPFLNLWLHKYKSAR